MKVLVTHGSRHGGTAEIAERVAATLRNEGHEVDVAPGGQAPDLGPYEAVIVGGALYMFSWHAEARRFVLRRARALREREVYFFSSGPLDDSASRETIPPLPQVAELAAHVGARGHMTFGGRLAEDVRGFPAAAMARDQAGDWRDWAQIEAWARELGTALQAPATPRPAPRPMRTRALPIGLSMVAGLAALVVAAQLAFAAGRPWEAVALAALVATPLLVAAWLHRDRADGAPFVELLGAVALAVGSVIALVAPAAPAALAVAGLALGLALLVDGAFRLNQKLAELRTLASRVPTPEEHADPT